MTDKTILVVDDQTNVRNILEFNLKRRGFQVTSAPDGLSAISQATQKAPDLILLDIMMPGVDGFQVLEKIRGTEKTKGIPILVVSAKGTEADIVRALKLGARDYVVKPFNLELLMQKIFRVLDQKPPEEPTTAAASEPRLRTAFAVVCVGSDLPENEEKFEAELGTLAAQQTKAILLDLRSAPGFSTLQFGRLAKIQQEVKRRGSELKLVGVTPEQRQTLTDSGLIRHFEVFDNWEAAGELFRAG